MGDRLECALKTLEAVVRKPVVVEVKYLNHYSVLLLMECFVP